MRSDNRDSSPGEPREPTGKRFDQSPRAVESVNETGARVRLLEDRYAGALYRAARRLTGCHEEAEDLVQETFTRAWRARATFRPGGNARAWLFAIMTNVRAEALRKARHAPPVADVSDGEFNEGLDDLECPVTRHIEGPEEAVLNAQPSEEVEAVLRQVPEHYRCAFLLAEVEHFSYQEISRMLGVPIGTVRSRVARGRCFLEQALWDYCVRSGVCRVPAPTTARGTWLPACRACLPADRYDAHGRRRCGRLGAGESAPRRLPGLLRPRRVAPASLADVLRRAARGARTQLVATAACGPGVGLLTRGSSGRGMKAWP